MLFMKCVIMPSIFTLSITMLEFLNSVYQIVRFYNSALISYLTLKTASQRTNKIWSLNRLLFVCKSGNEVSPVRQSDSAVQRHYAISNFLCSYCPLGTTIVKYPSIYNITYIYLFYHVFAMFDPHQY